MKKRVICFAVLLVVAMNLLTVVNHNVAEAKKKRLKITSGKVVSLTVGKTKTIKANQIVTWKLKNKKLAMVTKKRASKVKVRAKKPGKCTVIAKRGKQKAKVTVTIKAKPTQKDEFKEYVTIPSEGTYSSGFHKIVAVKEQTIHVSLDENKIGVIHVDENAVVWKDRTIISTKDVKVNDYAKYILELKYENVTEPQKVTIVVADEAKVKQDYNRDGNMPTVWGQYYIKEVNGTNVGLTNQINHEVLAHTRVNEGTILRKGARDVQISELAPGQRIVVESGFILDSFPSTLLDCKSIVVVE